MKKLVTIFVGCFALFCASLSAQITVQNMYHPAPGTVLQYPNDSFVDSVFFESLRSGSGGGMTWDFSSRGYGSPNVFASVNPVSPPFIDSFSNVDLAMVYTFNSDSTWQLYTSNSSEYTSLGISYKGTGGDFFKRYENITPEWVFPLQYNNQWTSYRHWNEQASSTYTHYFDTTDYIVDAWGTVSYFTNSFPCLRVVATQRIHTEVYDLSDVLITSYTQVNVHVSFITEGFTHMVGATKTTFFNISSYTSAVNSEFTNLSTDIVDYSNDILPYNFSLSQNYPNPFNPTTDIQLSIPYKTQTRLVVYDILGREVATLVDKELAAGDYTIRWDGMTKSGNKAASGVYYYHLISDEIEISKKMVMLK